MKNTKLLIRFIVDALVDPACFQSFSGKNTVQLILDAIKDNKGYCSYLKNVDITTIVNETSDLNCYEILKEISSVIQSMKDRNRMIER